MKPLTKTAAALVLFIAVAVTGCQKERIEGQGMRVRPQPGNAWMTVKIVNKAATAVDNLPYITSVRMEVKAVQVHYVNETIGSSGWVTLRTNTGIYDLYDPIERVMAKETLIPAGEIAQVRLILSSNSSIFLDKDGEHYAVVPPEYLTTGVRVNANGSLAVGEHLSVTLMADATRSIVMDGNEFILRPAITVMQTK